MMQTIAVIVVVAGALCYVVGRLYRTINGKSTPCCDCELKKNCKKFGSVRDNS